MPLKVKCSACGKTVRLPESDAGLSAVCPACGKAFVAPTLEKAGIGPKARRDDVEGDWPAEAVSSAAPRRRTMGPLAWGAIAATLVIVPLAFAVVLLAQRESRLEADRRSIV